MTSLRAWHNYLSIFVAPGVVFFALSGSLQLFNLHESRGSYQAPLILQELGRLHKDQVLAPEEKHNEPQEARKPDAIGTNQPPAPVHEDDDSTPLPVMILKWVFLGMALALVSSTCLGVWIALTHIKRRRVSLALLAAGTVIPAVLIALTS